MILNNKIKVFTHDDWDGVISGFLIKFLYEKYSDILVDVEYCPIPNIDELFGAFIDNKEYEHYDKIYMSDITFKNERFISYINKNLEDKFILLDHHKSVEELNQYNWANIQIIHQENSTILGIKSCASSLVLEHLTKQPIWDSVPFTIKFNLFETVSYVRDYDIWDWKHRGNTLAERQNNLFMLLGIEKYINSLSSNDFRLDISEHIDLLNKFEHERATYINSKVPNTLNDLNYANLMDKKFIIIYAEKYSNFIADKTMLKFKDSTEFDGALVLYLDSKQANYYTHKDDFNVSEVAKKFGGGGHPKASGSQLNDELIEQLTKQKIPLN